MPTSGFNRYLLIIKYFRHTHCAQCHHENSRFAKFRYVLPRDLAIRADGAYPARLTPNTFSREASVEAFMPSNCAAP
jgi:hypothetical protein